MPGRTAIILALLVAAGQDASAQVRERPVSFDSIGRVSTITPPLAARLGLSAPMWPVSGDYIDARLYAVEGSAAFVLVVRRPGDVLERYTIDSGQRGALASAVARGDMASRGAGSPGASTMISEPVKGSFIVNQTVLGLVLFGPAAAIAVDDPAGSGAAYLAVAGASYFTAANLTKARSVSAAQSHLAWHAARRVALAADLTGYALIGHDVNSQGYAALSFAGGLLGDIGGFNLGQPMTDAEAHGATHGSTVVGALTYGVATSADLFRGDGSRLASAAIVVASGAGYPLGLRYVHRAPYTVTAGDIGTFVPSELLAVAAAATVLPDHVSQTAGAAALTAGFGLGVVVADRFLVRPYDYTTAEARQLEVGTYAGALVGLAVPTLAQADGARAYYAAVAIGGVAGMMISNGLIAPARAGTTAPGVQHQSASGPVPRPVVRFTPEGALFAAMGIRGRHSIMSVVF